MPGLDKAATPDDILGVPELLSCYQRSNSGGVTAAFPKAEIPRRRQDGTTERYEKEHQGYLTALKKFIQSHPETVAGIELELDGINPGRKWAEAQNSYKKKVRSRRRCKHKRNLAVRVDTNLEGRPTWRGSRQVTIG